VSLRDLAEGKKPKRERFTRNLTRREVRAIKKRGYDAEREVVKMLRDAGYDALRVPVSAPSREPFPDVFAVKGDSVVALEVKCQTRYTYYKRDQVSKLHEFLEIHRYYPRRFAVLAAKFKYKGWCFKIAEKVGDYTIKVGEGLSFEELLNRIC
jgi:Holliday junction resolvase